MSSMVEETRGAFHSKPAWWDVDGSHVVQEKLDAPAFLQRAKMDYNIVKEQAARFNAQGVVVDVPNQFHLVRSDDGKVVSPSTVTEQYVTRQPSDLAAVLEPMVNNGLGVWDAGFTLYGGRSEVLTVKLCDIDERVACDSSEWATYLVMQNYHGTGKARGKVIRHRVVCHNTVTSGFCGGADFALTHKAGIIKGFENIPNIWENAAKAVKEHAQKLATLDKVVNVPDTIDQLLAIDDDATTQQKKRRDAIVAAAFMPSKGTNGKTLYDIFNAVTFFTTHDEGGKSGKTAARRMESILDGTRGDFQADMVGKLFQLAGV